MVVCHHRQPRWSILMLHAYLYRKVGFSSIIPFGFCCPHNRVRIVMGKGVPSSLLATIQSSMAMSLPDYERCSYHTVFPGAIDLPFGLLAL